MFFIFFTQVLLLKTNEYKARKKFKNLQLVGLIKKKMVTILRHLFTKILKLNTRTTKSGSIILKRLLTTPKENEEKVSNKPSIKTKLSC